MEPRLPLLLLMRSVVRVALRVGLTGADLAALVEAAAVAELRERGMTEPEVATRLGWSPRKAAARSRLFRDVVSRTAEKVPPEQRALGLLLGGPQTEHQLRRLLGSHCASVLQSLAALDLVEPVPTRTPRLRLREESDRIAEHEWLQTLLHLRHTADALASVAEEVVEGTRKTSLLVDRTRVRAYVPSRVAEWLRVGPVAQIKKRARPEHDDDPEIVELTMAVLWSSERAD